VGRLAELTRAHWQRGEPGRAAPSELVISLYRLWAVALAFKSVGASWDVSWHFKWLRDDFAPPHLVNIVGTAIVLLLVVFHTYTGIGADRGTLRWMQWGLGTFVIAAPLDVINHRINGLDITTWSPSHALLYLGTGLMTVGVLRGWTRFGRDDPYFRAIRYFLWACMVDNFLFPNEHQEYGVLGLAAWDRGRPEAEPSLLRFAADQIGRPVDRIAIEHFTLPVPDWVYPVWATATAMITLVLARQVLRSRWTATIIAVGYVGYRCVGWVVLGATHFPISTVPFFLVGGAVAVDVAFQLRFARYVRALLGAVFVTGATYISLLAQATYVAAPPVAYSSAFSAAVVLAVLWTAVVFVADDERGRRSWRWIVSHGRRLCRSPDAPPSVAGQVK
jgi:hypothetical protein